MVEQRLNDLCFGPLFVQKIAEGLAHRMGTNFFQSNRRAFLMNDSPKALSGQRRVCSFSTWKQIIAEVMYLQLLRKF
jgi:hypothetical protein